MEFYYFVLVTSTSSDTCVKSKVRGWRTLSVKGLKPQIIRVGNEISEYNMCIFTNLQKFEMYFLFLNVRKKTINKTKQNLLSYKYFITT